MKKFIFEIIFYFLLPLTVIAVVAEYSLRSVPNDYAYKNDWLEENAQAVNILCLGPSTVFYDINPVYLDKVGFNAAHVSQSIKYDHFIFNKFYEQMDSLQYVIIGIDPWTPHGTMEDNDEWWRVKYYSIHYGCDYHKGERRYNYELHIHNLRVFKEAFRGLLTLIGLKNESHITVNSLGYGTNYTLKERAPNWNDGKPEALSHNNLIKESLKLNEIVNNREYITDISNKCKERNIEVILICTPLHNSYFDNIDEEYVKDRNDFCNSFANQFDNVSFYDFSDDKRFSEDDFYDFNHLNENGAKKFTMILNNITKL